MTGLFCSYLSLEEASAKSQVTDKVKHLMSCALILEAECQVAEISVFTDLQSWNIEQLRHALDLLVRYRMLDDHDCIVNVSSLYQIVVEQEFDFVEEYECPAYRNLFRIYYAVIPLSMLNSQNS